MTNSDVNDYRQSVEDFFSVLKEKLKSYRAVKRHLDRFLSTDFNIFAWIKPDEKHLSNVIANLLNPASSHGQQGVFLDAFLRRIGKDDLCNRQPHQVTCEAPTDYIDQDRKIDILVDFGDFGLGIENKPWPWSKDLEDQLKDYCRHLKMKYGDRRFCVVYLTILGDNPSENSIRAKMRKNLEQNGQLFCVSYRPNTYRPNILEWLRECCQLCESDKFREFLRDFTTYIPTMEGSMSNSSEREIIVEHALENRENLENTVEIHQAYDELYKRISEGFCRDLQRCLEEHLDMSQWEFIPEGDSFSFAKREWEGKYKIGMQLYNETLLLGVYRKEQNGELIEGLVEAIKDKMRRGQQGKSDNWWEYYFKLEPFGPKVLVEMQFNRDVIKEQVCKELVKISKIRQAMQLIDEQVEKLKNE